MRETASSEAQASRRDVLRGVAGGLAALGVAPFVPSAAHALDVLTDDAVQDLRILSGAGGNVVVLATREGQIVVDSGAADSSKVVVDTLRTFGVPDSKVAVLVNTHWHKEQTGANELLGSTGTTIVAHEKTRQRLSAGWYVPASRTATRRRSRLRAGPRRRSTRRTR